MTPAYLSRRTYCLVKEGLAVGVEMAALAVETGLSEEVVRGIAAGTIGPSRLIVEENDPLRDEMLTARRCPGCGAMVYVWPCLTCAMAARAEGRPPPAPHVGGRRLKQKRRRIERERRAG